MYNYRYSATQTEEIRAYPQPVKRFLARMTDFALSAVVTYAIYVFILGRAPIFAGIKDSAIFVMAAGAVSAFLEAVMLCLFGTSVGKVLFGIRITGGYGRKLGFRDALTRNFKRFLIGEGLMLPIISLVRMYKSYTACKDGNIMDYDDYTVYDVRERPVVLSAVGAVICAVTAFALTIVLTVCGMSVPNKGDINTEQFIENYNYLVDYTYSLDINRKLDDTMRFVSEDGAKPYENTSVSFERIGKGEILDGIGLKIKGFNYNYRYFYDYGNEMEFIVMSLADTGFADNFAVLKYGSMGLGLDNDVTVQFADIKAEYSVRMENYKLDIRQNADSKHSGGTFVSSGLVKNPDGTYTKDDSKAFSVSFGRGRHMFGPVDEEQKSTLEMNFRAEKIK
ncbi:MAG: RDD family protein [Clostridia bacterium]|nr:RDD family protein [Clostridia bacterium]